MRWMSFILTANQMRTRTKTVTRRLGWADLQPGTLIQAAERTRGLTLAERRAVSLGVIRVVEVRRERLDAITADDVIMEGFPDLAVAGGEWDVASHSLRRAVQWPFIELFAALHHCQPDDEITRIEFEFVEDTANDVK